MRHLIIEYVLDGKRPGYNFTTPTDGLDGATVKAIWRNAMPRGQGWREYIGARSLKSFPLGRRMVAISEVMVTDQADEGGRQGIRRAEIVLMDAVEYLDYLKLRLVMLPERVRDAADEKLSLWRWKRILDRAMPKMREKNKQIILVHPYENAAGWRVVEAVVLKVATARKLRALKGWHRVTPLTTLALDPHDESRLVALPLDKARQAPDAHFIDVT